VAVTNAVHAARIPLAIATAQSASAITTVLRRLSRAGIGRAKLTSVLRSRLHPHAVDWLRALI
jgi:hypothetical protein